MTIWVYTFEDGTVLRLYQDGLSTIEVWKLAEIHGKCLGVKATKGEEE